MKQTKNTNIKKVNIIRFICLILVAAFCFSGCKKEEKTIELTAPPMTQEPELAVGIEEELPVDGGQLRISVPKASNSLDPLASQQSEVNAMLSLTYEKLIRYDGNQRLAPSLAESWDPVDEEGKEWRISLRKGASWQPSGALFSALDVLYTYELLKTEIYEDSPYSYHLNWIESLTAIDEFTLKVVGVNPGANVLHALTFPIVSRRHFVLGKQPVGTGPYIMDGASFGVGFHFSANESWWRVPPNIKSVLAVCVDDEDDIISQMQDGTLNFLTSQTVMASSFREAGEIATLQTMTRRSECLLINHKSTLLQDPGVRKAIAYALNRRDIITKAYLGHAFAVDVPLSPVSWLYNADTKMYDYNPEMSKELLANAGWTDLDANGTIDRTNASGSIVSLQLTLLVNDTPESALRKDVAELIKNNLEDIGIEVNIVTERWTSTENDYLMRLESGNFDLALAGFNMDLCPDLTDFIGSQGSRNYGRYNSAHLDNLLQAARYSSEENDILASSRAVQTQFVEDLPYIHLYFIGSTLIYNEHLSFTAEGASDLSDESPFYGIEKWYFDNEGRSNFTPIDMGIGKNWAQFDRGLALPEVEEGEIPTPDPNATPMPTPKPTENNDSYEAEETRRPPNRSSEAEREPTPKPSTPKPTTKPATPAPTPEPTAVATPKPTEAPVPEDIPEDIPDVDSRQESEAEPATNEAPPIEAEVEDVPEDQ